MSLAGVSATRGRQRLGDITNVKQESLIRKSLSQQERLDAVVRPVNPMEHSKLLMENAALVRLLGERNQIIEHTNLELQNLRTAFQKLQQQNWQLARSNSQILQELNTGKDRLKVLQHELTCAKMTLKHLKPEIIDKGENIPASIISKNEEELIQGDGEARTVSHLEPCIHKDMQGDEETRIEPHLEPCSRKDRPRRKTAPLSSSTLTLQVKGQGGSNKRRSVQKQSSDCSKPQTHEPSYPDTKNDSVDEDQNRDLSIPTAKSDVNTIPANKKEQDVNTSASVSNTDVEKPGKRKVSSLPQSEEIPRSSIGRPLRRATVGVSYKEIPLNTKMRRDF